MKIIVNLIYGTVIALLLSGAPEPAYAVPAVAAKNGIPDPYQAKNDPMNLPVAGPVMQAGSDAAGAEFDSSVLSQSLGFIKANLPDRVNNTHNAKVFSVDPSKLVLATTMDLQAYFVSESTANHNAIGFNASGIGVKDGNPELIFPNFSSPEDLHPDAADNYSSRTASAPLLPGDFVNLGTYAKGTKLDFFMIVNALNGGTTVFNSGGASGNPDHLKHTGGFTASVFATPQLSSPYLFINFKDAWGGYDRDYNDAVIAVNVGTATIHALMATPEPPMSLTLGGFLALAIMTKVWLESRSGAKTA